MGTAEHREREEEGDDRVGLQGPLDGYHRHQVAEQVAAGVPHEAGCRREAVPQEAQGRPRRDRRQHSRGVAVQRQRDHGERGRRDQADARREAIHPVDQVDHVGDGDDADDREELPKVDGADPRRVEELDRAGIDPPEEGKGKAVDRHSRGDRDDRRRRLAEQLDAGRQVDEVVDHPNSGDHDRTGEDRAGLLVPRQEDRATDQNRHQHGKAAELGGRELVEAALVRVVDRPVADPPGERLGGGHQRPDGCAREDEGEQGVDRVGHLLRASRGSGDRRGGLARVAVKPEREGEQPPDLPAQVLLARDVARRGPA